MSTLLSDASKQPTFQLKGTMLAITVFELTHFNIERLTKELDTKVQEAPEFFGTIPMVLGIDKLDIPLTKTEIRGILNLFQEFNIQLMAIRTDNEKIIAFAHKQNIVILPPAGTREKLIEIAVNRPDSIVAEPSTISTTKEPATTVIDNEQQQLSIDVENIPTESHVVEITTKVQTDSNTSRSTTDNAQIKTETDKEILLKNEDSQAEEAKSSNKKNTIKHQTTKSLVINTPVRSGQQITALDCDLIVTSNISTGAELISDGNIHIYGNMRGRAMAGFRGNSFACVFCSKLTAQLISIAGQMITEEELRNHPLWGKPAQLSLVDNKLVITPLS